MIYDVLDHVFWYRGISEQLDEALDILTHVDFESLEPGSYQVNDKEYYNVMQPDLHPWKETAWECHREYIDIQYALEQGEKIAVCPILPRCLWGKDILPYFSPETRIGPVGEQERKRRKL